MENSLSDTWSGASRETPGAIMLAGGLGTRLRPVVSDAPKSMAQVADRPFMEYLLAQLLSNGFNRAVICAGFMADALMSHFGDGREWGVDLTYSIETDPRGTAGALKLAEPVLTGDTWLLMNGDSLFDIALQDLVVEHLSNPALVTIALAQVSDGDRYGRITLDADGMITAFAEKTPSTTPGLINSGLYIIERPLLDLIPADRPVSLEREVIPPLVGSAVRGRPFEGYFIDIGVPDDYERAQREQATFSRLAEFLPPR
jgi:NDP-sugar pyrophosphorylase family protein